MSKADWHFPRLKLAEEVYDFLVKGAMQGISICGPQGSGKTRFLTYDLTPFAKAKGHRVIHVDFAQASNPPLGILLHEFDRALWSRTFPGCVKSLADRAVLKFIAKTDDHAAGFKIDMSKFKERAPHKNLLLLLAQYCERLANDRKPTFLLLDEFPLVAKAENGESLIAGLRASIQRYRDGLVAVFTGSSQKDLAPIFTNYSAPFFQFAALTDLAPLTGDFVDHQLKALRGVSEVGIDRERAVKIFRRFSCNPLFFQRWLLIVASDPSMSDRDSIYAAHESLAAEFGFNSKSLDIGSTQRVMERVFGNPVDRIYGKRPGDPIMGLAARNSPLKLTLEDTVGRLSNWHD